MALRQTVPHGLSGFEPDLLPIRRYGRRPTPLARPGRDGRHVASPPRDEQQAAHLPRLIAVGQSHALVLGFDPASTAFLPNPGAFVRRIAADSEEELLDSVEGALASVVWEETVTWDVPGPVVLLDSACPGGEVHEDERLRVEMAAGRYRVQAAEVTPGPRTTLCLVQFVPVT
ncbi:Imm21 family immunity protein [Streptomyces mirabilis]|uniref:Imm21 family immunity protein n=1 Tax=Streptomyces mirabilis TaxID=68239 RepID=UPI003696150B